MNIYYYYLFKSSNFGFINIFSIKPNHFKHWIPALCTWNVLSINFKWPKITYPNILLINNMYE